MQNRTFSFRFFLAALTALLGLASSRAQTNVLVDPAQSWAGFMNVFSLPADGGGYQFGGPWAGKDLRAAFGGGVLTLQPCTNVSNPADAYWVKTDGSGNKQMEANWYVDTAALVATNATFSGNSVDYTLPTNYICRAFIKVFPSDYSSVLQQVYAPITNGNQFFTVSLNATNAGAAHVQYGFVTVGPNAGVGSAEANSAVTIRTNAPDPANVLVNPGFEQGLTGWTSYGNGGYTETQGNVYYNGGSAAGASNVLVWEGTRVQKVFASFTGGANYNGIYQDLPGGPGSTWSATAKMLTHQQDQIGVWQDSITNQCWLEVTFRDANNNVLATFKSQTIDNSSPTNTWLDLTVTNDTGGITLTAPDGTAKIRLQEVYYQPSGYGGGSVYADAMVLHNLTPSDPNITSLPANATKVVGQTATFTVGASGQTALTYQWTKDNDALGNGGRISGADTATLTIANVQKSDIGTYSVIITDQAGTLQASASLNVKTPEEAANLLENPSFETGAFAPWTKFNGGNVQPATAKDGSFMAVAFNGGEYNGAFQDVPAKPGDTFSADVWFLVPSGTPLVNSSAWLELQFRNGETPLALYRSSIIDANTTPDTWIDLRATNGFAGDFTTPIANADNPVAPANTTTVRFQITYHALAGGSGTVNYDAAKLSYVPSGVQLTAAMNGANISISFPTQNGVNYEVVYKDNLGDAAWTPVSGGAVSGDGTVKTVSYPHTGTMRFYSVRAL